MIDTFACCGKSTGEKILLPNLFKQAMVKFSFLVTNLTFQESDSSLAERWAEKHSFLEALKCQIPFGNSDCPLASVAPSAGSRLQQRRAEQSGSIVGGHDLRCHDWFNKETNEVCQITLEKLPLTLALPGSVHKLSVFFSFFFLLWVWSYLLWQTSPGDHPSFDNLENDCIGKRVEGGIERERERERERDWVAIENICSMHL